MRFKGIMDVVYRGVSPLMLITKDLQEVGFQQPYWLLQNEYFAFTYTVPLFSFCLVSIYSFTSFTSFPFYFNTYFAVCISTSDPFSTPRGGCIYLMFGGCSAQFPERKT